MKKKSGLGRGLDALFVDNSREQTDGISMLRISDIEPRKEQPRKNFDTEALSQLAESIGVHGLIQPIVVRGAANGYYQIIAGERRWRAAKMAGLSEVPVIITEVDDMEASELALVENIQRENLSPIEEAAAYKELMDEYELSQEALSKKVGKSRSAIANSVRLLDLPKDTLNLVSSGRLSAGHARALLALTDKSLIDKTAQNVAEKGLSVRETEALVKTLNKPPKEKDEVYGNDRITEYFKSVERRATETLGRTFKIHNKGKSKKIEISFDNKNAYILHTKRTLEEYAYLTRRDDLQILAE